MSSSDAGVRVPRGEIALRERLIDKGDCVDRQGMRSESGLIVPGWSDLALPKSVSYGSVAVYIKHYRLQCVLCPALMS